MPKRIPISAARRFMKEQGCTHVIIYAHDGTSGHVVTVGKSTEQAGQAADFGNELKKKLGWPESLTADQPSRVRRLRDRVTALKRQLARHDGCSRWGAADALKLSEVEP